MTLAGVLLAVCWILVAFAVAFLFGLFVQAGGSPRPWRAWAADRLEELVELLRLVASKLRR